MFKAQRIRLNKKINSNSKSLTKMNHYRILFRRNENEIKKLLFSIGEERMNRIVNGFNCSQISKFIIFEIKNIIENIYEKLNDEELNKLKFQCN